MQANRSRQLPAVADLSAATALAALAIRRREEPTLGVRSRSCAATSLAQAKDIGAAREQFSVLSEALPGGWPSGRAGVRLLDEGRTVGSARQHGGESVFRQGDGDSWNAHKGLLTTA